MQRFTLPLQLGRWLAWVCCLALFAALLSSVATLPYAGFVPETILVGIVIVTAVRPIAGLAAAAAIVPFATYAALRYWNGGVLWSLTVVCATLTGGACHALIDRRSVRLPARLAMPAIAFAAVVAAAIAVALRTTAVGYGPRFASVLRAQILQHPFEDLRSFPALQAGLLLLEGTLLFLVAARAAAARRATALPWIAAAVTTGAVVSAAMTAWRVHLAAARAPTYWPSLGRLIASLRWNVTYADMNAAGSFYLLALFLAVGLALSASTAPRRLAAWTGALASLAALWLTGSRAAQIAVGLAAAVGVAADLAVRRRVGFVRVAAIGAAGLAIAVALAALLPAKGTQVASSVATDVRIELARTGLRMIESAPVFGLGLAQFAQRSGEFSSPRLLATFPPAVHENAHNNFVQVAAELGLLGGLAFVWLVFTAMCAAFPWRTDRPAALYACAWLGLFGFVVTWLAGHPLLVPEAGVPFWIVLGTAAGAAAAPDEAVSRPARWVGAACLVILAVTLPYRFDAARRDANLEHVGIGVSQWHGDDTERYRSATGEATLFVPAGTGFKLRIKPLTEVAVALDVELDGRLADRIVLEPGVWNDLRLPARTQRPEARYAALRLSIAASGSPVTFRLTKVEPIGPQS